MICRCLLLLALSGGAAAWCRGAIELTPNSPFMPPGGGAPDASAAQAGSSLELHGIVSTPQGYKFDLFDPATHKDMWVGFNETGKPYVVQAHDIAHNRVTVEYQGRQLTLTLPQPKVSPMGGAQMMPMMSSPMNMGPTPAMTAAPLNPDDERRRIELITEEIKRRRALRAAQQRQLQIPPGAVPVPPQPRNY